MLADMLMTSISTTADANCCNSDRPASLWLDISPQGRGLTSSQFYRANHKLIAALIFKQTSNVNKVCLIVDIWLKWDRRSDATNINKQWKHPEETAPTHTHTQQEKSEYIRVIYYCNTPPHPPSHYKLNHLYQKQQTADLRSLIADDIFHIAITEDIMYPRSFAS